MSEFELDEYWKKATKLVSLGKKSEAIFLFRRMVAEGSVSALVEIGNLYELPSNDTISQDFKKSAAYYRKSIRLANDKYALYSLARLHMYGCGVEKNFKKARELLINASEQNLCIADLYLGRFYRHGYGVEKNESVSAFYYNQAILKGSAIAQKEWGWINIKQGKILSGIPSYIKGIATIFSITYSNFKEYGLLVSDSVRE